MSYSDVFPDKKTSSTDVLDGNLIFVTTSHNSTKDPAIKDLVRVPSQADWSEAVDGDSQGDKAKFVPFRPDPTTYQYMTRQSSDSLIQHLLQQTTAESEDERFARWATKEGELVQRRLRCEKGFKDFLAGTPAFAHLEVGRGPAFIVLAKPL